MGREAVCTCDWAGEVTEVKALLEPGELILRGGLRKRIGFQTITQVRAQDNELRFRLAGDSISLALGAAVAAKWAEIITSPPPSLARKLGIPGKTVRTLGRIDSPELNAALQDAAPVSAASADLIVAGVDTPQALNALLAQAGLDLMRGVPLWVVYAKGKGNALDETAIREFLRGKGLMDTKVASVSPTFTALRFIHRKSA